MDFVRFENFLLFYSKLGYNTVLYNARDFVPAVNSNRTAWESERNCNE